VITNLEERKITLLSQIDRLKREIDGLKWLEYRDIALCSCIGSVRYIVPDRLWENLVN
jgi:hypothetical protein